MALIEKPGQASGSEQVITRRRQIIILLVCCMSLFIVGMDSTIVNVALPSIGRGLKASISGLQWTIDAYTVVLGSLLMLSGSMADRFGRRRTFQLGLFLFTVGSFLCSLSPTLSWLVVFRIAQAIGGSMLNPVAMSIIRNTFEDPKQRAQAVGVWGAVVGISMALGPVIGGALVQSVGWRSIFWVNIPIGLTAILLTVKFVPESKAPHSRKFDPVGQVLVIVGLGSLIYSIIEGPTAGWSSPEIIGIFFLAAMAVIALVVYERKHEEPLLQIKFFSSIPFSGATLIAVAAFAAFSGFLFLNTLYLQDVRGLSALGAGLYTLPLAAMTILASPISGSIVGRRGPRLPLAVAGVGITIGALMLTRITDTTPFWMLVIAYLIFGFGFGFVNPPITNTAISGMPPSQAGVAAAVASTSRQIGGSMGVAVIGVAATSSIIGASRTAPAAGLGAALKAGLAQSSHNGWWIVVGCGVLVFVLGFLTSSEKANATAYEAAGELGPTAGELGQTEGDLGQTEGDLGQTGPGQPAASH